MKKNKFLALLFILGLFIFLYPHVAQFVNNYQQKEQVHQFKNDTDLLPPQIIRDKIEAAKKCNEDIFVNEEGLHDPFTDGYDHGQFEECKEVPLEGENFATIEIPKLKLEIPIYLGATENELSKGIGQVEGSSLPVGGLSTHTVLAGHRGMGTKEMFRNVDELEPGDIFYIYTLTEKIPYIVYNTEVILPNETNNLQINEGKDLASLITCHPYRENSHRLVIQGERAQ